ncbi:hypothetical protein Cni_G09011 [Canna indica]|uniref:Calmodulin-binding protein n=1 Tax=Canna indica TaxID=4628 RepID=A0AAQ3Q8Y1_9LILI|nr:hypothetical protein Cni_G09011 [Canna indica]
MELGNPCNGEALNSDDSSPGRAAGYFFSCPASPVHYVLSSPPYSFSSSSAAAARTAADDTPAAGPFEFDGAPPDGTMSSADELFLNGQIRPLRLCSHLRRPQTLAPLMDLDDEEGLEEEEDDDSERGRDLSLRTRSRSIHRRTRSMSPLRSPRFQWQGEETAKQEAAAELQVIDSNPKEVEAANPPESSSPSSRSSSASSSGGRNSKRWIFLKDLVNRSKSEGSERGNGKDREKFWHSLSFSPSTKPKPSLPQSPGSPQSAADSPQAASEQQDRAKPKRRPTNGGGRRRGTAAPSAHERHYTTNRAQAEEMRRRTFLPYRQGLLGCLGFTSRGYSAFNGLAKALNPVTSG